MMTRAVSLDVSLLLEFCGGSAAASSRVFVFILSKRKERLELQKSAGAQ
jgi:hypothetical protein